jgi:hypothetical protein
LAGWQNPVVASPAAQPEMVAALDALGPSLVPRTSVLESVSMGLSVLWGVEDIPRQDAGARRPW